jgi:quercetin dioxygenase-like cupin family protein
MFEKNYQFIPNVSGQAGDIPADSILSKTFYQGSDSRAILFRFAAGQELSEHTASKPAILHFLRGTARLTLGDDAMEVGPGAWVHMAPNLAHSIYATSEVDMLLYMIEVGK